MGKVFDYLGISTGCITNNLEDDQRKNYSCDIIMQQIMSLVLTI